MSQNMPGPQPPEGTWGGPQGYPGQRAEQPDGLSMLLDGPGTPTAPRGGRPLAVLVSSVSFMVSVSALGVAVYALNTASDRSMVNVGSTTGGAVSSDTNPSAVASSPGDSASSPAALEPEASESGRGRDSTLASDDPSAIPVPTGDYTPYYQDQQLSLRSDDGCQSRPVDLDQPAVNVAAEQQDLEYQPSCSSNDSGPTLRFHSDKVAIVAFAAIEPNDCAQAIRLSPSAQDIKPNQDLVICELTNGVGASDEPARPKIVRLVVTGVGKDQPLTLTVTAWEIPH